MKNKAKKKNIIYIVQHDRAIKPLFILNALSINAISKCIKYFYLKSFIYILNNKN